MREINSSSRPCNFFQHAVCVSGNFFLFSISEKCQILEIIDNFQLQYRKCVPACTEYSFKPESMQVRLIKHEYENKIILNNYQYMRVSSRRIDDIHGYLKIPPEIYIASMVVKLSDEVNVVLKEKSQYNQ